tara:strand:- start:430 stop:711 length:282 start_codon:yes stop_codon:yes gene_type:complete
MEIKLENGKKVKIKKLTIDEKDSLLDSCKFSYDEKGVVTGMQAMHSTMTKFLRTAIDGNVTDELLESFTFQDRTNVFENIQSLLLKGELKPSK